MRRKGVLVLLAGLLALGLVAAGCGEKKTDDPPPPPPPKVEPDKEPPAGGVTGDAEKGKGIFAQNCATCHGNDGTGGVGPNLHGVQGRLSEEEHINTVTNGRSNTVMPAWKDKLTEQDIKDVVSYERTLK